MYKSHFLDLAPGYVDDRDVKGIHVYTDGTGGNGEQQPAFALAIIKTDQQDRQTFGGLFCHRPSSVEDPWLAGADCNGVPQNETAAIIATLAWLLQSKIPEGTVVEIMPDAKYAIGNSEAEYSPKNQQDPNQDTPCHH